MIGGPVLRPAAQLYGLGQVTPCRWALHNFYDKADLGESGNSSKLQRMAALNPT